MHLFSDIDNIILSPSTRRAWIEIPVALTYAVIVPAVALHPEGVDRNLIFTSIEKPV